MAEEAKDEQVADDPANRSGPPPPDTLWAHPLVEDWPDHGRAVGHGTAGGGGLITAIAALIAAGLTGIAAIIKAWAQLLFARADMIRARSGQPAVEVDQGGPEPGDGANGGDNQTGA
ncbi:hypothetical protein [Streptomyces hirsutus]|uniref:hypothetical protein n=1 Tax=Streptomyces hirsutus TaxID=35620 RepID=UPI000A8B054F|nr:hypothetical protein [Streptomyces hirsutus]